MKIMVWTFTQVICTGTLKTIGTDDYYKVNGNKLVINGDNNTISNVNKNVTEIIYDGAEPMYEYECKKESGNKLNKNNANPLFLSNITLIQVCNTNMYILISRHCYHCGEKI